MTAIITIKRADEILLLTDGLSRSLDGTVVETPKCLLIPCGPALVAARGVHRLHLRFGADCLGNGLSFDKIIDRGGLLLRHYFEGSSEWSPEEKLQYASSEIYLAGNSQREGLQVYMVAMDDRYQFRGQRAFEFQRQDDEISIAPGGPEIEPHLETVGYNWPNAAEFDPTVHGPQIMDAQRMISDDFARVIGKHIQLSTVKADGTVSGKIIHRWPAAT